MELGKKETLYQPLIDDDDGEEEVQLNPSDAEPEGSGFVVAETEDAVAMAEVDRGVEEGNHEAEAEKLAKGPKGHSSFHHVFYDESYKITKLPLLRRLKLIFNMYYSWWLLTCFWNMILIVLYIIDRTVPVTIVELASFAVGNLFIAVIVRNEFFVHLIYYCAIIPRFWRLYLHRAVIEIGGLHSSTAVWGTLWTILYISDDLGHKVKEKPEVFATGVILVFFLLGMILTALPWVRARYHNIWEIVHRIFGWSILVILITHIVLYTTLKWDDGDSGSEKARKTFSSAPFWMTILAGASVFHVWFIVQIVPKPYAYVPNNSGAVVAIRFPNAWFGLESPGTYARISTNYIEWHSFSVAVKSPDNTFQVVIAAAGDWTKRMIKNVMDGHPPPLMFVRRVKPPGFMYCIHAYKRVVAIATGAGIAPVLPHVIMKTCPMHVVWVARDHKFVYGDEIASLIFNHPWRTIFDTATDGKPDAVGLALKAFDEFDADACFIVSNPFLTFALQRACKDRPAGHRLPCYGATWDS